MELQQELDEMVKKLLPYHPKKIILFGSLARGDSHDYSDIDLLIIKDTPVRFVERIDEVLALLDSRMDVDPLVYTPDEIERMADEGNDFILTVMQEGKVIYEQQS